jgi:hypothetical protein
LMIFSRCYVEAGVIEWIMMIIDNCCYERSKQLLIMNMSECIILILLIKDYFRIHIIADIQRISMLVIR